MELKTFSAGGSALAIELHPVGCHDKNCVEQDKSRHDREPIAPSDFFEKTLRDGTENEKPYARSS